MVWQNINLTLEDVEIISTEIEGWVVESEGGVTVAIDSELDDELIADGFAREFVNRDQNMRKTFGLDVTDRINVGYISDSDIDKHLNKYEDYIANEILADSISNNVDLKGYKDELNIGEYNCKITIDKVIWYFRRHHVKSNK